MEFLGLPIHSLLVMAIILMAFIWFLVRRIERANEEEDLAPFILMGLIVLCGTFFVIGWGASHMFEDYRAFCSRLGCP